MKAFAELIGIVAGLVAWLAVGAVGLLASLASGSDIYYPIGGWCGIFAGLVVWSVVSGALKKKRGGKQ